jgi:hypothetical protein
MTSERITTGKGTFGGHYAKDSKGNIGRGNSESAALEALRAAQSRRNNK